jgi:putative aminopeptidase FrvX
VLVPPLLHALLSAPGPSGYEDAPADVWRAAAREFADRVETDIHGSSVAVVGDGAQSGLALFAHIDEIGLVVRHIDEQGMLWFTAVGHWNAAVLVGQRVEVQTAGGPVVGLVGPRPAHAPNADREAPQLRDLHIDIGAKDRDEAREIVSPGDAAVIAGAPVELRNGRVAARALDDRLGCYVILEAARRIANAGGAVAAVAAVQEETTFAGAHAAAHALCPHVAIAVDVTFATDAPGVDVKELGAHGLGSGASIGRGPALHPHVSAQLHATAAAEGLPFTVESHHGRATRTDADAIQLARGGVPVGLVSIPLRYMHSPVELAALEDTETCIRLLVAFAQRLADDEDYRR